MSPWRAVLTIVGRELRTEWRDPSRIGGLFVYGFALILMVAFAMPGTHVLPDLAGGALWLGLLLASTRSLDASLATELEHGALEAMILWPVAPAAIFYGKALANTLILVVVAAFLGPLIAVLYHPPAAGSLWLLGPVVLAGCAAVAAPGTLVATLTTQARGSSALLPVLLFPLLVPVLLAAARATTLILEGDPMHQADDWLGVLIVFNLLHWSIDPLLFERVVDEG